MEKYTHTHTRANAHTYARTHTHTQMKCWTEANFTGSLLFPSKYRLCGVVLFILCPAINKENVPWRNVRAENRKLCGESSRPSPQGFLCCRIGPQKLSSQSSQGAFLFLGFDWLKDLSEGRDVGLGILCSSRGGCFWKKNMDSSWGPQHQ